jgi:predicted acylesterase/phospholipase RssA
MTTAIVGGVVGAIVGGAIAAVSAWLVARATAIENFFGKASGATWALEKARNSRGTQADAEHLAGEVSPLADTLGMRIERLAEPAKKWAAELEAGRLEEAKQAMGQFSKQARFAGFGR